MLPHRWPAPRTADGMGFHRPREQSQKKEKHPSAAVAPPRDLDLHLHDFASPSVAPFRPLVIVCAMCAV